MKGICNREIENHLHGVLIVDPLIIPNFCEQGSTVGQE